jgi:hypothetical protein
MDMRKGICLVLTIRLVTALSSVLIYIKWTLGMANMAPVITDAIHD